MEQYYLYFKKGRKAVFVRSENSYAEKSTALERAVEHLNMFATLGIKNVSCLITTDEFYSPDDTIVEALSLQITQPENIPDSDESEDSEAE